MSKDWREVNESAGSCQSKSHKSHEFYRKRYAHCSNVVFIFKKAMRIVPMRVMFAPMRVRIVPRCVRIAPMRIAFTPNIAPEMTGLTPKTVKNTTFPIFTAPICQKAIGFGAVVIR